jgi:hypothetical protein
VAGGAWFNENLLPRHAQRRFASDTGINSEAVGSKMVLRSSPEWAISRILTDLRCAATFGWLLCTLITSHHIEDILPPSDLALYDIPRVDPTSSCPAHPPRRAPTALHHPHLPPTEPPHLQPPTHKPPCPSPLVRNIDPGRGWKMNINSPRSLRL